MSPKVTQTLVFWTGVTALLLALGAPAAAAATELKQPTVADYPVVEVTAVTPVPTRNPPRLWENGHPVAGFQAENLGRAKSVVLAVDRSRSMEGQAFLDAVAAARRFVALKPPDDRLAVVSFGSRAAQLAGFSSTTIDPDIALRTLAVDGRQGTALNDAVSLAARMLAGEPQAGRVLVLLTDGDDEGSVADEASALRAAKRAGLAVYAIGMEGEGFSPAPLERLAEATGGSYRGAASSTVLAAAYDEVASELRRTWRIRYVTAARPGERLHLETGPASVDVRVPGKTPPPDAKEPSRLLPTEAYENPLSSVVVGLVVGVALLLATALLAAAKRGSWLKTRLAPHVEGARRGRRGAVERERFAAGSALLRATESAFGHLALWRKTHSLLERADVPLRTVEFLYISAGSGFVVGLLAAVSAQSSIVLLLALVAGAALPFGWLWFKAAKRRKAFENQLPDLLLTLAASLKAGHSFKQGIQTVVDEGQPPASKEFQRALAETQLGRPMEDALGDMAQRVASKNLDFVITAVTIQGQIGGSLAGLFDMVAEAVRQRQQFARKIRGLTAMGRASAYVLVGLPILIAGAITLINGDYMHPLWHTATGHTLIAMGLGMMSVGALFLKKIVSFRG